MIDKPVQIDEIYFQSRRKYNRRRYLQGNQDGDLGPWVLGICTGKEGVGFIQVPNRSAAAFLSSIETNAAKESLIWTDEWAAYNRLNEMRYLHNTANHSENFINQETGANTQIIERLWKEGKIKLKAMRKSPHLLRSHLMRYVRG